MNPHGHIAIPKPLRQGARVAVISTARKITPQQAQPAFEVINSWGFEPVQGPNLYSEHHQFAGDDNARAADLQWAVNDPDIDAIICARGGYGTIRILPMCQLDALEENPKWIAGYSDVTALHNHIIRNLGVAGCHSTMAANMKNNTPAALDSLRNVLTGGACEYSTEVHPFSRDGLAEGPFLGGNLSMLYSLNGTPYFPELEGAILFLEDLDELLYHVDRMMKNLKASGVFEKISGLVIGGMTGMRDNKIPFGMTAEEIVYETVHKYSFPVVFNLSAGHLDDNRALRMGVESRLEVEGGVGRLVN